MKQSEPVQSCDPMWMVCIRGLLRTTVIFQFPLQPLQTISMGIVRWTMFLLDWKGFQFQLRSVLLDYLTPILSPLLQFIGVIKILQCNYYKCRSQVQPWPFQENSSVHCCFHVNTRLLHICKYQKVLVDIQLSITRTMNQGHHLHQYQIHMG